MLWKALLLPMIPIVHLHNNIYIRITRTRNESLSHSPVVVIVVVYKPSYLWNAIYYLRLVPIYGLVI